MEEKSYTYKCPSCGSAIEFNSEKNMWICEYCKNTYNNLFLTESEELEDVEDYNNYYYFYCENCHNSFYSKGNANNCYKCGSKIKGTKEKIGGTISTTYDEKEAAQVLINEFAKYKNHLPGVYFQDFILNHEYIMCDFYNGSVVVTNGVDEVKYFFVNTIIPRIKTDNYRIYYDFANAGFNSLDNYVIDPKYNYVVDKGSHDIENNYDDIKDKIVEACKFSFRQTHSSQYEVSVKEDLDVKKNILIRVYYANFKVDGEDHRCYVLGFNKQTRLNKINRISLDFPYIKGNSTEQLLSVIDNLRGKSMLCKGFGYLSVSLLFILVMGFFAFLVAVPQLFIVFLSLFIIAFPVVLATPIFLFCRAGKIDNEIRYVKMCIRGNEKDFYYNLVNNSNFVKKVGR